MVENKLITFIRILYNTFPGTLYLILTSVHRKVITLVISSLHSKRKNYLCKDRRLYVMTRCCSKAGDIEVLL